MSIYLGNNLISGIATPVEPTKNIGQIIQSTLPLTDAGLHLLDGALISGSGSYSAFVDYIADLYTANPTANYFTDETTWQNTVTQYGVCGKFVYNSVNNTVRLPKVTGKIDGTTDINALGDLKPLLVKLPNITGHTHGVLSNVGSTIPTAGAIYEYQAFQINAAGTGSATFRSYGIDASRSSSVYSGNGSDTTIHEQAINVLLYIVIATSTKTDIQVDIDEIATDLNGKADTDLSNVTDAAKILMGGMAMPSNRYINLTLGASGTQYTAPADGWFCLKNNAGGSNPLTLYNQTSVISIMQSGGVPGFANSVYLPCSKGDIVIAYYTAPSGSVTNIYFIYAKGSESEGA